MHKKIAGLLALLGALFIIDNGQALAATRRASVSKPIIIVRKKPNDAPDYDWMPEIRSAQALLAKLPADKDTMTRFTWHLAVKCGSAPASVVSFRPNATQVASAAGYRISWPVDNGINTHFAVKSPAGCVVLAQRRVIRTPTGLTEAVYTAYTPELDTKTMRTAGLDYLQGLRDSAFDAIAKRGVDSLAEIGMPVSAVIPRRTALVLMITEHVDPLRQKFVGLQQCIHEVLVTAAANRSHAYEYAVSKAGARGLPQFMPRSYALVRTKYPGAGLSSDFVSGMNDHANAVLASVLLFDLEFAEMPSDRRAWFLKPKNDLYLSAFLAAGYNCNPVKVVREYLKTKVIGKGLPAETQTYVRIQHGVAEYLGV